MEARDEPLRLEVEVGDSVLARWPGVNAYFVGTAIEEDDSGFRVVFEDGDIGVVGRSEVFRNDIVVGRRVFARWKDGSYYPGTVARIVGVLSTFTTTTATSGGFLLRRSGEGVVPDRRRFPTLTALPDPGGAVVAVPCGRRGENRSTPRETASRRGDAMKSRFFWRGMLLVACLALAGCALDQAPPPVPPPPPPAPEPGSDKRRILETLSGLEVGGSTAGGAGIRLAYALAREHFLETGNNRVILATDGAFNVGVSSESALVSLIERERGAGVFLTVLGFGTGNLQDSALEQLADHGTGHYAYVDSRLEARQVLVEQMGATLLTVAKDVKLQVEFNPTQVKGYRLLGYENRRLRDEAFNDDEADAGDMGAGHTVTALYELIPAGSEEEVPGVDPLRYQQIVLAPAADSDDVLTVTLRYTPPEDSRSRLLASTLTGPAIEGAEPSEAVGFSAAVAEFGLLLRDSAYKGEADHDRALHALGDDEEGSRSELLSLIRTAGNLAVAAGAGF